MIKYQFNPLFEGKLGRIINKRVASAIPGNVLHPETLHRAGTDAKIADIILKHDRNAFAKALKKAHRKGGLLKAKKVQDIGTQFYDNPSLKNYAKVLFV